VLAREDESEKEKRGSDIRRRLLMARQKERGPGRTSAWRREKDGRGVGAGAAVSGRHRPVADGRGWVVRGCTRRGWPGC
jgi:hypothetical protein